MKADALQPGFLVEAVQILTPSLTQGHGGSVGPAAARQDMIEWTDLAPQNDGYLFAAIPSEGRTAQGGRGRQHRSCFDNASPVPHSLS